MRLERVRKLGEVGAQHRLLAQAKRLRRRGVPADRKVRPAGERFDRVGRGRRSGGVIPRRFSGGGLGGGGPRVVRLGVANRLDGEAPPRDLRESGVEGVARRARVRAGLRRIEVEQRIARLHRLSGLDVDRRDLARIERLDHLEVPGRLDLPGRDGVHVEPAEERPGDRREREQ